jgi:arsenite/tail-anchored protein-transporting ATPase
MIDRLEQKRLIYVTGKGGVGKSTVTAALGRALAARGRRTLIIETDAFSAMPDLLGLDAKTNGARRAGNNLWAENLEASECFVQALGRFVPSERIARAVVQNRVARVFFKAAPAVNEFVILDQITEELEREDKGRPRYDNVIVDLPASGHAVTFLGVPQTLHGMMKVGPIAKRADHVANQIADDTRTAILAVCLPEEMPVNETLELADNLQETLGRGLTGVIINMVHGLPVDPERREVFEELLGQLREDGELDEDSLYEDGPALNKVVAGNALALGWYDRDQHYLNILRERLDAPVYPVPVIYEEESLSIVDALAEELERPDEPTPDTATS